MMWSYPEKASRETLNISQAIESSFEGFNVVRDGALRKTLEEKPLILDPSLHE